MIAEGGSGGEEEEGRAEGEEGRAGGESLLTLFSDHKLSSGSDDSIIIVESQVAEPAELKEAEEKETVEVAEVRHFVLL